MTDDQTAPKIDIFPLAPSTSGASGRPGDNPPSRPCAGSPVNYHPSIPWNEETVSQLWQLYCATDPQLSFTKIADALSTYCRRNITRNAVMGYVDRKNWPKHGAAPGWRLGRYPAERKPRVRKRKLIAGAPNLAPAPIVVQAPAPELPANLVPFAETKRGRCRFIFGDSPEWRCCSRKALPGCSWCREHAAVVFTPAHWSGRRRHG